MRILGIDYGTVRVGLAICDQLGIVVSPYAVLPCTPHLAAQIAEVVQSQGVQRVVVGMPYQTDGTESALMTTIKEFIQQLRAALPCPVEEWDEAFSSRAAVSKMVQAGVKKKRRRQRSTTDTWAAAIILQDYLESLR